MTRKMKDSGVEWISEIPENWDVLRIKNVAQLYNGNSISDEEKANYEDNNNAIPYIATKNINSLHEIDYKNGMYVKNEQLKDFKVATKNSTLMCIEGGSAGIKKAKLNQDVCFVNKLCCFAPNRINDNYLYYFLNTPTFEEHFKSKLSGLICGVSISELKTMNCLLPPLNEQQKIAAFLDDKCGVIDEIISKTEQTIEEYKKLKQSVITKAVTKGIHTNRKMKDSGIEWIGEIPEDWDLKKLKYVFEIKKDIAGKEGYTVLSITQTGIKPKNITSNEGQLANDYSKYQLVNNGDFAMNHMDLLTGWVDISKYDGVTSPDYRVFRLKEIHNCGKYFLYMMQLCYLNKIFYGLGQGVSGFGRWRLPTDMFSNFLIQIPPLSEQKEIADYLDKKCSEIDVLIEKKQQFLAELANHKKSLIYEYVTGKKEIV